MKKDDFPIYLAVNNIQPSSLSVKPRYKVQPIEVNKLNSLLRDMVSEARLGLESKRLTNRSVRKYLVQKLNDNEIPPTQIMQITAHSHSLMPFTPTWRVGHALPGLPHLLYFLLNCPSPCDLRATPLPLAFPFWRPVHSSFCNGSFLAGDMAKPP